MNSNVQIRTVQRAGAVDRDGEPRLETIYVRFFAYLDESRTMARRQDGDFQTIDGTLEVDSRYAIKPRDVITVERIDSPKFQVFDAQPDLDVHGQSRGFTHRLVRIENTVVAGVPDA